jgi:hypothetical protein
MTLVSFKSANHPQQIGARGVVREKDERYTPRGLISSLHAEWNFTVDAAGCSDAPASQIIGRWWGIDDDGLSQSWDGERVWCNPPFSCLRPWLEKAWASRAAVCMLIPANRTEQHFWQDLVEPYRDRLDGVLRTRFITGETTTRVQFGTPENPDGGKWGSSPPFGCVLLMWPTPWRPEWAPGRNQ